MSTPPSKAPLLLITAFGTAISFVLELEGPSLKTAFLVSNLNVSWLFDNRSHLLDGGTEDGGNLQWKGSPVGGLSKEKGHRRFMPTIFSSSSGSEGIKLLQ